MLIDIDPCILYDEKIVGKETDEEFTHLVAHATHDASADAGDLEAGDAVGDAGAHPHAEEDANHLLARR